MQQNRFHGEGGRGGTPRADDYGWDDSLYRSPVPEQRGNATGPDGTGVPGARPGGGQSATDGAGIPAGRGGTRGAEGPGGPAGPDDTNSPDDANSADGANSAGGRGGRGSAGGPDGPDGSPGAGRGRGRSAGRSGHRGTRGGRRGKAKVTSRKVRAVRWALLSLVFLIVGTVGGGYLYYQYLNSNLTKDKLNLGDNRLDKAKPNAAGQTPLNILLLGSDSRNSKENLALGGHRESVGREPLADVQMLLHVSADRSNMSVVSIPRDTRVTIPTCTDPDDGAVYAQTDALTINKSLQHGGPGCTVAAWEELTGVPIDHFMMIDFAGVVSMADAVGGVEVCVSDNVHDKKSGLKLEAGPNIVKGEQALQWLRTRHGFEDGSDIGRAKAQHMYMASMVRELKAGTKLSDPNKLRKLAESATKALTVDDDLGSIKKLYDLAEDIKRVPTERITMVTMPWAPDPRDPLAHVVPKEGEAEQIFSMLREDTALDGKDKKKPAKKPEPTASAAPKGEIVVQVQNGTGTIALGPVNGRAGTITSELVRLGFDRAETDRTARSQADTAILYAAPEQRGNALAVAKALGIPERSVRASAGVEEVTLIIGADWREGAAYPESGGKNDPPPSKAPESANALQGDESKCMEVNPLHVW